MRCFYNIETGKIKTILDVNSWEYADEEPWIEESNKINKNIDDYYEFERFKSFESFQIMVDFTEQVEDNELKTKLNSALSNNKPFQNFKWQIHNSGEQRREWFEYKKLRYVRFVKE